MMGGMVNQLAHPETRLRQLLNEELMESESIESIHPLSGGSVSLVYSVKLNDEQQWVAKIDPARSGHLLSEAWMLTYLQQNSPLPVPEVLVASSELLLMSYCPSGGYLSATVQQEVAHHIALLHHVKGNAFGLERDTVLAGLPQPNLQKDSWVPFFIEQRLLHMAGLAYESEQLPLETLNRLDRLANRLDQILIEPAYPALLHGDLWHGNILVHQQKVSGFIDPAVYYGSPEIELAFATLFNSLGESFFEVYRTHHPIEPGFFEERCDLYNLYPLLVHTRLFGGTYLNSVHRILDRFGY